MPEKTAIRDLMGEIAGAQTLESVYQAALRCLQGTLGVERAAMLLLDDERLMRFVASSGLSEHYRRAAEGHSPWSPDDPDAQVVLVENTRESPELRELLSVFEAEGIGALAFVPLRFGSKLLGKLMLYYPSPYALSADEIVIAEIVAGHVAFALEHRRLAALAEEARSAAERATRQFQILAGISAELASALDPAEALQRLAQRIVETMADYCVTYSYDGSVIKREGLAHRLARKSELVALLASSGFPSIEDKAGAGAVIRNGAPILAPDIDKATIRRGALNPTHEGAVLALGPRSAMVVPLKSRGRTVGAIAFATTDDSARRYDEDDLKLAIELAARAAMLVDNAGLYAEAKGAVRVRDEMIQLVSHDLRNPLQSISTAAALLQFDLPQERRERSLESISLATTQMNRLLQDLLDISQIDAGRFSIEPETIQPKALIGEAYTLFSAAADEKLVALRSRAADNLGSVYADRSRLLQVLSNFVGNALKFVPSGGTITISAEREQGQNRIRFTVTDSGPGVPPEHLSRVFERFWRGDNSRERGAGLGLAVAKGIVEAHGGEIGVDSELGVGSAFYFLLSAEPQPRWPIMGELGSPLGKEGGGLQELSLNVSHPGTKPA
ncbi:MAG TPA: ATP-binding protein [Gammaproteobacteria bacterium]|nr:ATP-binding protein [Gammaproteobacteria bacterium]